MEAYLISLDSFSKIIDQINLLNFQNKISDDECEFECWRKLFNFEHFSFSPFYFSYIKLMI